MIRTSVAVLVDRWILLPVVILLALSGTGCDLVREIAGGDAPRDVLRRSFLEHRASAGALFLGRIGDGPIRSVESAGPSTRTVTVPDEDAPGSEATWELTLERVEVYPLHGGEAFADWIQETATAADRRAGLTLEGWRMVAGARVLALGRLEGRAVRTAGSGRVEVDATAVLRPATDEGDPTWEWVDETRTVVQLRRAVVTAYEELMYDDERVMDCAETADPRSAPRVELLECASRILDDEFAQESDS